MFIWLFDSMLIGVAFCSILWLFYIVWFVGGGSFHITEEQKIDRQNTLV